MSSEKYHNVAVEAGGVIVHISCQLIDFGEEDYQSTWIAYLAR